MGSALAVAQQYFDAWNRRDPAGVLATFAPGGAYSDPSVGEGLTGEAIAAMLNGLWQAFPDLHFDILGVAETGNGGVAGQWLMLGTNHGPIMGLPPTGRAISLPGADFIQVSGDKIQSVRGYFDTAIIPRQLGLKVQVGPERVGPFVFGAAAQVQTGKRNKPGAFSITALNIRSPEEQKAVSDYSRDIAVEMLGMRGFISFVGVTVGDQMLTISAWDSPEDPAQLMSGGTHGASVKEFFGADLSAGGAIGVWVPHHIGPMWVRCPQCGRMTDSTKANGVCRDGHPLPEPHPYW